RHARALRESRRRLALSRFARAARPAIDPHPAREQAGERRAGNACRRRRGDQPAGGPRCGRLLVCEDDRIADRDDAAFGLRKAQSVERAEDAADDLRVRKVRASVLYRGDGAVATDEEAHGHAPGEARVVEKGILIAAPKAPEVRADDALDNLWGQTSDDQ